MKMSNVTFNNILFSAGTISWMHPSLARLYEAAQSITPPIKGKSAVAAWLNDSPQAVNNWEKRGVSRRAAMVAQQKTGYSASWIRDGVGPKTIGKAVEKGAVFKELSSEERELIDHWRLLLGKDRRSKLAEVIELAKERQAEKQELFEMAGIPDIMERAANATRRTTAHTTLDANRLRQKDLPLDEPGER